MNPTLKLFAYSEAVLREIDHRAVLIRPVQTTQLSCVIAARAAVVSLGGLTPSPGAELPQINRRFEVAVRRIAPAKKLNYHTQVMLAHKPHFLAIPRYTAPLTVGGGRCREMETLGGSPKHLDCAAARKQGARHDRRKQSASDRSSPANVNRGSAPWFAPYRRPAQLLVWSNVETTNQEEIDRP